MDGGHNEVIREWHSYPNVANSASNADLMACPAFIHKPLAMFSSNISQMDKDFILAKGIPALSSPLGGAYNENANFNNNDFNDANSESRPNGWPRTNEFDETDGAFRHSDIVNVALPYLRFWWRIITTIAGGQP